MIIFEYFQGFQLNADLTDIQKSELKAYMALVGNTLVNAEEYLAWNTPEVSEEVMAALRTKGSNLIC